MWTVLLLVSLLGFASWHLIDRMQMHAIDAQYEKHWAPTRMKFNQARCPAEVKLWNCIRHAMYRRDI